MKLQELPENYRKAILFIVLALLAIVLFFWWGRGVMQGLQNLSAPQIPEEFIEQFQLDGNAKTGE